MSGLTKCETVNLAGLHKALRLKSIETACSVSEPVNQAVREEFAEDVDDLAAFEAHIFQ